MNVYIFLVFNVFSKIEKKIIIQLDLSSYTAVIRMHCKIVFNFTLRHDYISNAVNKMTAHWFQKLDPYWSIRDMMKTNKGILSHARRCK